MILVDQGNYCLATPGETYAIYLPKGGAVTIHLPPHRYEAACVQRSHWRMNRSSSNRGLILDFTPSSSGLS